MKYYAVLIFVFVGFMIYAGIQIPTGITGKTEKNGTGCICHNPTRDLSVMVRVEGPDTLFKGETGDYEIFLSGGPAVGGGFNVASHLGSLAPGDGTAQLIGSELTHTSPKTFVGSTISWEFSLTAADMVYTDTIYSASNSVNLDGFASALDRWNFGSKFVVHVVEQPTSVSPEGEIVNSFILEQNYPNPFNPSTIISWQAETGGFTTLKVYDALGNEVSSLVNEFISAGKHQYEFTASGLSSGIYYYNLVNGNFSETKKMILLR